MISTGGSRRGIALALVVVVVLGALPGLAAAATRSGGTVVVPAGETVDGLTAYGGTIVVRGTVDGDLEAYGGNVYVEGEVTGGVEAFAGNVRVSGTVGGDVSASAGNVVVEAPAEIGGSLSAAAGTVVVAGTVGGDVEAAAGTVTLAETATVDGDVTYAVGEDGGFVDGGATVGGTVARDPDLEAGAWSGPSIPGWTFDVYGVLVTLALGAALLVALPGFSRRVADRAVAEPVRSGGVGLLALVAVPVALLALAVTIVGIPLSIVGGVLFGLLAWVAVVYARYALGTWLVSLTDLDSRWLALLAGTLAVAAFKAAVAIVPPASWLAGLAEFGLLLVGLGALGALGYGAVRRRRGSTDAAPTAR